MTSPLFVSKKGPRKARRIHPVSPSVHDGVRGAQTRDDDHDSETVAQPAAGIQVPVVRGGVIVGFCERVVHAATQNAVLVHDSRDTCERRCKVGEDADEHMSRHVLRLYLCCVSERGDRVARVPKIVAAAAESVVGMKGQGHVSQQYCDECSKWGTNNDKELRHLYTTWVSPFPTIPIGHPARSKSRPLHFQVGILD